MLRFVLYLVGSQVLSTALGLVSGAIINRTLGPALRGDYAELSSWIVILTTICGCSSSTAILHFSNTARYRLPRGTLLGSAIASWALTVTLAPAGIALFWVLAPRLFSENLLRHLVIVLIATAAGMASAVMAALLRVGSAFKFQALMTIAMQAAMVVVIATLALNEALDVSWILWSGLIVQFVAAASAAAYLVSASPDWRPFVVSAPLSGRFLLNGLKIHLATVATLLYVRVDQVMLYSVSGDVETGLYAVAVTIAMQTLVLPLSAQEVLYPRVLEAEEGDDALVTMRVVRMVFFAFAASLGVVWVLAAPLVSLYAGAQFVDAVPLLRTLLIGILCFSTASLLSPYWVKRGHFILASGSAIALLGLNVLLNLAWIPSYGAAGAVWATNVTYLAGMVVSLVVFAAFSGLNPLLVFRLEIDDIRLVTRHLASLVMPWRKLVEGQ